MNQKTAKLIRRYATLQRVRPRTVKRAWNGTPRNARHALRKAMTARLN